MPRCLIACVVFSVLAVGLAAPLKGIDVSHYQGSINWKDVKNGGFSFAMAKATEGLTYVDPTFGTNYAGMHAVGLVRSAYHFGRPGCVIRFFLSFCFLSFILYFSL
jgi:hypothetical protein